MIDLLNDTTCIYDRSGAQVATLDCIAPIFANVIFWLLVFAGIVALVLIIYSGIKFITSSGDQKQVEGARKILTYAIAGLVLILLSFAIVRLIADVTGVGCITKFGLTNCQPKLNPAQAPSDTEGRTCTVPSNCGPGNNWSCINSVCVKSN